MNFSCLVGAALPGSASPAQPLSIGISLESARRTFVRAIASGISALALTGATSAAEPLVTQSTSFRIPFTVQAALGMPASGKAILFRSVDNGPLEQVQRVPASADSFEFMAPRDGHYAFAVRMTDSAGNVLADDGPLMSELEVLVDSTAPTLQFDLVESGPGQVLVRWDSGETEISPRSLTLEYAEGTDGRWKPLAVQSAASGETTVTSRSGTVVAVRGAVTDLAGNRGDGSRQLVLSNSAAASQEPASVAPASAATSTATVLANSVPLNVSPWTQPGLAGGGADSVPFSVPSPPVPPSSVPMNVPEVAPANPAGIRPVSRQADPALASTRHVNSQTFEIAYDVDGVGPSGVGRVELFVTQDNGQQWFRYGVDEDRRSPFLVDVQAEGTFGFAMRASNGVGVRAAPPQPGEAPDVLIAVDQTAPVVELAPPQMQAHNGSMLLNWQISDVNAESATVRLDVSMTANGPWTSVFDWHQSSGQYEWSVPAGTSHPVYFRLSARDVAGNTASATSAAAVIDHAAPTARMLHVQPTSDTGISL